MTSEVVGMLIAAGIIFLVVLIFPFGPALIALVVGGSFYVLAYGLMFALVICCLPIWCVWWFVDRYAAETFVRDAMRERLPPRR